MVGGVLEWIEPMAIPKGDNDPSEIGESPDRSSVGKVNRNGNRNTNLEPDALVRRRIDDEQEDERIRSDDPPSDEGAGISEDHRETDPKIGHWDLVDQQASRRSRFVGDATLGHGERQLRMGLHSVCRRWLAVLGVSEKRIETDRGPLDGTRICGCRNPIGRQGSKTDCRFGR